MRIIFTNVTEVTADCLSYVDTSCIHLTLEVCVVEKHLVPRPQAEYFFETRNWHVKWWNGPISMGILFIFYFLRKRLGIFFLLLCHFQLGYPLRKSWKEISFKPMPIFFIILLHCQLFLPFGRSFSEWFFWVVVKRPAFLLKDLHRNFIYAEKSLKFFLSCTLFNELISLKYVYYHLLRTF